MNDTAGRSEDLCYLLKRVANQISRIRDKSTPGNPASGMGMILSLLVEGREMNQLEMANTLQIRNASLSEAIIKLEKRGYVVRRNNPRDRRSRLVSLTEKGINAERMIRDERDRTADAIMSVLTGEERATLYDLLHKLSVAYIEGRMQPEPPERDSAWNELVELESEEQAEREPHGRPPRSRELEARFAISAEDV